MDGGFDLFKLKDFFTLRPLNYYIMGEVISGFLSLLLSFCILLTSSSKLQRQKIFLFGAVSASLAAFFDVISVFCNTYFDIIPLFVCSIFSTLYFIFLLIEPFVLANYAVKITCAGKRIKNIACSINGILYALYFILILLNMKFGWVFRYDKSQGYIRGPLKSVTYILTFVFIIFTLVVIIVHRKNISKKLFGIFIFYPICTALVLSIQFFNSAILLTGTAAFTTLLFTYITIQSDMSDYDMTSGLLTENCFAKKLQNRKNEGSFCVFLIDNFNSLQSNMDVSDVNSLLVKLGNEFSLRFPNDSYYLSGNRFAIIGKNYEELLPLAKDLQKVFERINKNLECNIPYPLDVYSVAANFEKGDKTYLKFQEIIATLLNLVKRDGEHSIKFCDKKILEQMERRQKIYDILNAELTLESKKFQVCFQPIYSLQEEKFTYMEALSRLVDTELGDIKPTEFIPVAESRGLTEKLGFVVLEKVCRFISENKKVVKAVSVNFSAIQMANPKIIKIVLDMIKTYDLKPENVIIEITESMFIDNFEAVRENMFELSKNGIRFYLDDFGTGYSNISNVVALPFNTIKVDRSLVLMMEDSRKNTLLVKSLVSTFKSAGLNILIEGVETEEQNKIVNSAGADYIQGFLYSKPLPANECLKIFKK